MHLIASERLAHSQMARRLVLTELTTAITASVAVKARNAIAFLAFLQVSLQRRFRALIRK
ncbi:hypothetical protein PN498_23025 [Oscillatoria sp. CS-180]|uniref:hypothetical protein n=1 Tax=Oscillatoria sp. CS-180 TaxID=3021720 RepID=UPI00233074A9|nr:hypothetical protein [Oscillatoria sp. CS-180]MDB9528885.1 hypothetical protein [Oscillatoria sp. CS-180]